MPELHVDLEAIGRNTEVVVTLLRPYGVALIGVTKGCLGEPRVGAAMLAGGAVGLADTRDHNLRRLRAALPQAELHRIYLPSLAESFIPGDITYVSSWEGAEAVAAQACSSRRQRVMLQVETGDEREGVPVEQLADLAAAVSLEPRLKLAGLATNYACFRGAPAGIRWSVDTVCKAARELRAGGIPVPRVSAGNSSVLALILRGDSLPSEVTELRCGEALLLGQEALSYQPIPGCRQDACLLRAEVVEEYTKPTPAQGKRRLVLSIGRQDLGSGAVRFTQPGLNEIGRSSDYLVVEVDPEAPRIRSGQIVEMIPSYEALVAAWTSPYVELALR